MENEIFFFHNISNWRPTIKIINIYKSPTDNKPMTHITKQVIQSHFDQQRRKRGDQKITKFWTCTIQRLVTTQVERKRRSACQTVLIWSIPFVFLCLSLSQKAQSPIHTHTHTKKRMLSNLIVNCAKMERLLGKLRIYSSWPTNNQKCLQCGVLWDLKLANCCKNNRIPQFVACHSLWNQNSPSTEGTVTLL